MFVSNDPLVAIWGYAKTSVTRFFGGSVAHS